MECACNDGQPFLVLIVHCIYVPIYYCVFVYSYKHYDEFWSFNFKLRVIRTDNSRRIFRTVMMNLRVYIYKYEACFKCIIYNI